MERSNDIMTSFKRLEVTQRALPIAKEDYKLVEMWWAKAVMQNFKNEVSSLIAAMNKVDSSLQIFRSMTIEELRVRPW